MTAARANLINAVCLIVISAWAYLATDMKSFTALIPAVAGLGLLLCTPGVRAENKAIAHVAVLVTLLLAVALVQPLVSGISDGDAIGTVRVLVMMATCILAMVFFIRSFIDARRSRA